ncbi:protein-glutamine gamma-glutamyltransferase E-like [Sebastes umbrosus]|uniref:protein-glutamine gamma-glutamyltransferase E-like n=1 Tax=Sebastes umbrosus TaxID=72105 RepID=UPI0018A0D038|nr:protein-glutamine gamma-glutamyltransferase E-like [Sebastes umbrosus]
MAAVPKESLFNGVDLHIKSNNSDHNTSEISKDKLIVRRGKPFKVTLNMNKVYSQGTQLSMIVKTAIYPSVELETLETFDYPDPIRRPASIKFWWMISIEKDDTTKTGKLTISITPPADSPIGELTIMMKDGKDEVLVAELVLLYNPWCPDDMVYMKNDKKINEYVMNEHGVIFRGSADYIFPLDWDFGQFEDNMVNICLKMLDLNLIHLDNPTEDFRARADPGYVGRVVSAMVNANDDPGVVVGRWDGSYEGGKRPGHWTGSHEILKRWFNNSFQRVQYGQCWVFAGVMCSVMRLLGIPTRVITNFSSAHDTNENLTIDEYHAAEGVRHTPKYDSIWNYHVWVESWMKRPDLSTDGKYDGWQVLDATPQEESEGLYRCGPASVRAIRKGEIAFKYDMPFVFAEVNADVVDWLEKADGSLVKLKSDSKRVGKNISTKSIWNDRRKDVTHKYKPREGSEKERDVFKHAATRDYSSGEGDEEMEEEEEEGEESEEIEENVNVEEVGGDEVEEVDEVVVEETDVDEEEDTTQPEPLPIHVRFTEVTPPTNGKNVRLKLVLTSKSTTARLLSITISVQAMMYNGTPAASIWSEDKEEKLNPGKALSIPIQINWSDYRKPMLESDSLKVSVMVTDKEQPENIYLAEDDVVLMDPPISVTVSGPVRVYRRAKGEVLFTNPVKETLKNCTLTLSGSGLWKDELVYGVPDLKPGHRVRIQFNFIAYKAGKKTLVADFDCSTFRDIKGRCTVNIKPY